MPRSLSLACCALATLLALTLGSWASAEDLLPADKPIEEAINHYITARLAAKSITPAPLADDANLLRRTMLDLVGRPPIAAEVRAYQANTDPAKRTLMVDSLLATPSFVRQQTAELDALLMKGARGSLRDYLAEAVKNNKPWSDMFRDMIVGQEGDTEQKGAIQFIRSRTADLDQLTADASVLFFGVNVSCAKCHDHPLVSDWTQEHYFGMKSFFSRTFEVGDRIGEKSYGLVDYKTVEGESKVAKLMFLTSEVVDEPASAEPDEAARKAEKELLEQLKKEKQTPPAPAFSRRAKLVEVGLAKRDDSFFARAAVNHTWNRLLGRGLVMPVDQMHSENPASHPELLAWLARDFQEHNYDLKRLVRGIVLSEAYARSSRWEASSERPADDYFAAALVRPLKPWQYATALRLATLAPERFPADLSAEELEKRMEQTEGSARGLAGLFELPGEEFQVSVDEALLLSNSDRIQNELLRDGGDTLVGMLEKIDNTAERAETAVWQTTARNPESVEVEAIRTYFDARSDRRKEAVKQVIWSLITSSELRFNY
ncbi:protein of unknown function DUF1549 [Pirellula staleyi DSM 6068]|uniref:DUF1549 domain-containing protein n=1 Tax=Pirellula staleyi (strain ATCC 27377 / DSM 6068 / ICPB 4128) TaxID=530564 RepID=D2R4H5_PIRSD|nr:DUF1549 domain-containing protein [Pirellula staleyi]ADB15323.1 protein of unknown function DUF1549 [Pirellula staleyi DSM 6068]